MKTIVISYLSGALTVWLGYQFSSVLKQWRANAIQKAKDKLAQTVSKPNP